MHVAITGASSGIGDALAREFARAGAAVTLVARRRERLDRLATELGGRTFVFAADLSIPERAADFIAPAEAALGPIDVLVNNAGVQLVAPLGELTTDDTESLLRLNVLAPLRLVAQLLPAMRTRRAGTIVNIASVAAWTTLPGMTHYNASKAALAAASETMRAELRRSGVHVVTVYPGPVDTPLGERGLAAYGYAFLARAQPMGRPEVLAARIRRAVERRRARVIYPRFYHLARWLPNLARLLTDRFAPRPKSLAAPAAPRNE